MEQSTNTHFREQLHIQNNAEPVIKPSSSLTTREEIPNTPFHIHGDEEKGYYLTYGMIRLSEAQQTPDDVTHYLTNNTWNVITAMITGMIAINEQLKEKFNKHETTNH